MTSVEAERGKVGAGIAALSDEIKEAKRQLKDAQRAGDGEAVRLWLRHLTALQEKQNLLLKKEARLQTAVAEPSKFPDYVGRFKELLLKRHIRDTPAVNEVVEVIARRLPAHLMVANTPTRALDLYDEAKLLPGASTQNHLLTQHNLRVNKPLFPLTGPASLLTAFDGKGRPCVVKLLQGRIEVGAQGQPGGSEARACEALLASAEREGVSLIRGRVLELSLTTEHRSTLHPPGRYAALLCDQYCNSVAESLQLPEEALEAGVKRMVKAVEYMHGKGLAHMDIKGDNIFIDYQGQWFLGDFGSTIPIGAQIESTTEWFLPTKVLGRLAEVRYDWYMLAAMLAAELDKVTWKERPLSGSHTLPDKLAAALQAAVLPSLKDLIADILVRAEVPS